MIQMTHQFLQPLMEMAQLFLLLTMVDLIYLQRKIFLQKRLMVVQLSRMHILNKQVLLFLKIEPSHLRLRMIVAKELQVPEQLKILLIVLDLLTIFLQNINQIQLQ